MGDGIPKLKYNDGLRYISITYLNSRFFDELHDVAIIDLPFNPKHRYDLADETEKFYLLDELRAPGESGLPLLDEGGKICGVLSKQTPNGALYAGVNFHDQN